MAYVYDHLTQDIDRKKIAGFIEKLFEKHGLNPRSILDLGCGTGVFCMEMCQRGYEVTGVDLSSDMLSCAKTRAIEKEEDILLINQDMTKLELDRSVDAAVCLVDSVNHITDPQEVKKFFHLVSGYLNPGGLFIFDINTRYKLETVMGGNVFYNIDDDIACIWQCNFNASGISKSDITLFIRKGCLYERFDEIIYERSYGDGEIKDYVIKTGFKLLGSYDGDTFEKPKKESERIYYVCRK